MLAWFWYNQLYSAGGSEVVLGKAIKQLGLPREEIVVITKARLLLSRFYPIY